MTERDFIPVKAITNLRAARNLILAARPPADLKALTVPWQALAGETETLISELRAEVDKATAGSTDPAPCPPPMHTTE